MEWHEERQVVQQWFLVQWGPELQRAYPVLHDWRKPAKWGRGEGRIIVFRVERPVVMVAAMDLLNMEWTWARGPNLADALDSLQVLLAAGPERGLPLPSMPEPGWAPQSVHLHLVDELPF